jgi:hypothetical protein
MAKRAVLMMVTVLAAIAGEGGRAHGQALGAGRLTPNLEGNVARPLRYVPENGDFVIQNGAEFFNRPLYGGNTAFRVDAGDKPEFTMYLPGRGGNLRLGVKAADGWNGAKWLSAAERVEARYRPGGMVYEIRDPALGSNGVLHVELYALAATEGLVVKAEGRGIPAGGAGVELLWAYGGVNGQRGTRDGDIGTERVPISQYFQLSPDFCKGNVYDAGEGAFTLRSTPATIFGRVPGKVQVADARAWESPEKLFGSAGAGGELPVVAGRVALVAGQPLYLSLQKLTGPAGRGTTTAPAAGGGGELPTYQEAGGSAAPAPAPGLLPAFSAAELPEVFARAEAHFRALRGRVKAETPDPFIDAAVGALNVGADAIWDEPQGAVMHGAVAWRSRLLGWRGPYAMDALGWHDRARRNMEYWATRQNTKPVPDAIPSADESANLARNEAGLHTNGDMSNSHYDMNLVHIDAVFRHLLWTGDVEFAKKEWPVIERHLAWERRLFRREYAVGTEKLPLYEAYAAIWASDDLEYFGGGTAHASAYNYYHNTMAARVAKLIGVDPAPYEKEAGLILRGMRELLWVKERGTFAEFKDYMGLQKVHPEAALWSVYHTIDSEVATPLEAWEMTKYVDGMPHIPVKGEGVPTEGGPFALVPTSTWMPYTWSINNVCMNENAHTALAYFQAGRAEDGARLLKSCVLASMFMGISPGNVGTMTYLDVYRRESQRDFGDGNGTLSRAVVEGLFGIKPDGLAKVLRVEPGFPRSWEHARFEHPDVAYVYKREGMRETFVVEPRFKQAMALRMEWAARTGDVARVMVNGADAKWSAVDGAVGWPRIRVEAPAAAKWEVVVEWKGEAIREVPPVPETRESRQGAFRWRVPAEIEKTMPVAESVRTGEDWTKPSRETYETVDLSKAFNAGVTEIFKQEYRSPRSPFVSLAIPKQGIGAWAGHVNASATIDDTGLRAAAAKNGGKFLMPNGAPFAVSAEAGKNIVFTSLFDNFPNETTVAMTGRGKRVLLLMAGTTNWMQSRFDNGEVVVTYADGTSTRLALENPTNWWPIEQDYFVDDYQFRRPGPVPPRVDLKTGTARITTEEEFKGKGREISGGAATVVEMPVDPSREMQSLTVRTLANEVVIGVMGVTVVR